MNDDREIVEKIEQKLQDCNMELEDWRVWNNMKFIHEKQLPPSIKEFLRESSKEEVESKEGIKGWDI